MPQKLLLAVRLMLVLVASGLLVYLLMRGGVSSQLRVVLIAALAFYVVRLWLTASRMRRARLEERSQHDAPSSSIDEPARTPADEGR